LQGKENFLRIVHEPDDLAEYGRVVPCPELLQIADREWQCRHFAPSPIVPFKGEMEGEPKTQEAENEFYGNLHKLYPKLSQRSRQLVELGWHIFDRELMNYLADQGCNMNESRVIDHNFICSSKRAAEQLVHGLEVLGHSVVDSYRDEDGSWQLQTRVNTSLSAMTRKTKDVLELAMRYQVDYDGWGTCI
jgi:regulator of RNase E activity RraB